MIKLDITKGMFLVVLHRFFNTTLATEALCVLKDWNTLLKMNNYALCDHSLKVSLFVRYYQEFS